MCVLYVNFGSKVRTRNAGCVAMVSALLFIVRSRLLLYYAGSGMIRVQQVVLYGFSVSLFCPDKNVMYVWLYVFLGCTRACVCRCNGDVICVGHRWSGWW